MSMALIHALVMANMSKSHTHLAHHELESVSMIIIIIMSEAAIGPTHVPQARNSFKKQIRKARSMWIEM